MKYEIKLKIKHILFRHTQDCREVERVQTVGSEEGRQFVVNI